MGNKYLETKNDTLESSILDVWKDAAKLDEYKTKLGEKKRVSGGSFKKTVDFFLAFLNNSTE